MIEIPGKALFPTRVFWWRIRTANISADNLASFAQSFQRPLKVGNGKAAALPVCHRLLWPETIQIDGYVNARFTEVVQKGLKPLAPIVAKDGSATCPIFHRPIVCPRMHFERACSFGAAVAENLMRPPTFKTSTAPHGDALYVGNLQCAIDQITAGPFRRTHVPIRMIVKRDENHRLGDASNPKRSQVMKITGAVEYKRERELRFVVAVKLRDQTQRRGEAQFRPPMACINNGQSKRFIPPRVIQI